MKVFLQENWENQRFDRKIKATFVRLIWVKKSVILLLIMKTQLSSFFTNKETFLLEPISELSVVFNLY